MKIEIGDVVVCNDVLGVIVGSNIGKYKIRIHTGAIVEVNRVANIAVVANSYSISNLIYEKILQRMKEQ